MAAITFNDQVVQGLQRLITQWQDKPNVVGLLTSFLENVQNVQDVYEQLNTERGVYTAIGVQLDDVGTLVGELRDGKNDDAYRSAILDRITINSSSGTPEDMIQSLKILTDQDVATIFEYYPAHVYGFASGGITNSTPISFNKSSPAGVSTRIIFDGGGGSFIGAGTTDQISNLQNDEQFDIQVVDTETSDLLVVDTIILAIGTNSFLPHVIDTEIINPLAAVLPSTALPLELGALLLENGDGLAQDEDIPIAYQII